MLACFQDAADEVCLFSSQAAGGIDLVARSGSRMLTCGRSPAQQDYGLDYDDDEEEDAEEDVDAENMYYKAKSEPVRLYVELALERELTPASLFLAQTRSRTIQMRRLRPSGISLRRKRRRENGPSSTRLPARPGHPLMSERSLRPSSFPGASRR